MSHYWALFREINGQRFRFDTRIYLRPCDSPRRGDKACGRIIGKNPGSASPSEVRDELQSIELQGDHFLPTVLSVARKAYRARSTDCPDRTFIRVHNLFYLCDRDLREAKRALRSVEHPPLCDTERLAVPWTWFAWGGPDPQLDVLKQRFIRKRSAHNFFYCGSAQRVEQRKPRLDDRARHTQGMPHAAVIAHLTK
ncbi:MAG: hypothetical protein AB8B57_10690 [Congregibacter sp.]